MVWGKQKCQLQSPGYEPATYLFPFDSVNVFLWCHNICHWSTPVVSSIATQLDTVTLTGTHIYLINLYIFSSYLWLVLSYLFADIWYLSKHNSYIYLLMISTGSPYCSDIHTSMVSVGTCRCCSRLICRTGDFYSDLRWLTVLHGHWWLMYCRVQ